MSTEAIKQDDTPTKPSLIVERRLLPSIDAPQAATRCDYCGEAVQIVDPVYCGPCSDRIAAELRQESGDDYRRQVQVALDLAEVRRRTRAHVGVAQRDERAEGQAVSTPTLATLKAAIYQAGLQAEALRVLHQQPGRTHDVVENVSLELQQLSERVDDEIRTLKSWGEVA